LAKTQDDEQIEETKLCQNSLPTHPSIHPFIHPSSSSSSSSSSSHLPIPHPPIDLHPNGALIGKYDKTYPSTLDLLSHT
jgi:hypothetical protein